MRRWCFGVALTCVLSACDGAHGNDERVVVALDDTRHKLAFTCVYEADVIPPRDPEADRLYRHARWLYNPSSAV